jgi:redox-sensitive bicupin YhaK (pirin superfamily)
MISRSEMGTMPGFCASPLDRGRPLTTSPPSRQEVTVMKLTIDSVQRAQPRQAGAATHHNRLVVLPGDFAAQSPFLLMAEDWFAPPSGFPTHPHRGMETVTFVLEGRLEHKDHTGAQGDLGAGDVQFMTAGNGVLHSEMPGPGGVHSLQLWLNLPAAKKRTPARYAEMRGADAPVHRAPGVEARLYAGRLGDVVVPHGSTWPLTLIDLRLEAGAAFDLPVPAGERAFAFVVSGEGTIGAEAVPIGAESVAWPERSDGREGFDVLPFTARTVLRAIVFASPAIDEPVIARGPFVMNTMAQIEEAYADYRAGRLTEPA